MALKHAIKKNIMSIFVAFCFCGITNSYATRPDIDYREALKPYLEEQRGKCKEAFERVCEVSRERGQLIKKIFEGFPCSENNTNFSQYVTAVEILLGGNSQVYTSEELLLLSNSKLFENADSFPIFSRTPDNHCLTVEYFIKRFIERNDELLNERLEHLKRNIFSNAPAVNRIRQEAFSSEMHYILDKKYCKKIEFACKAKQREDVHRKLFDLYKKEYDDYSEEYERVHAEYESLKDAVKTSTSCPVLCDIKDDDISLLRKKMVLSTDTSLKLYCKMQSAQRRKDNMERICDIYTAQREKMDRLMVDLEYKKPQTPGGLLHKLEFLYEDDDILEKLEENERRFQPK